MGVIKTLDDLKHTIEGYRYYNRYSYGSVVDEVRRMSISDEPKLQSIDGGTDFLINFNVNSEFLIQFVRVHGGKPYNDLGLVMERVMGKIAERHRLDYFSYVRAGNHLGEGLRFQQYDFLAEKNFDPTFLKDQIDRIIAAQSELDGLIQMEVESIFNGRPQKPATVYRGE